MVGWNEEANQIADVSLEGYVGDIEVADAAALVFMNSGRVVKASRLLGGRVTLSALSNNFHSPEASSMIDQVLACANWTQEDIENPLRFVRLFLREKMVLLHDVVSKIGGIEAGAAPRLISEFSVAMNPELAVAMEADLYAALAEKNFPAETSGFLVVMLSAAHHSVGH